MKKPKKPAPPAEAKPAAADLPSQQQGDGSAGAIGGGASEDEQIEARNRQNLLGSSDRDDATHIVVKAKAERGRSRAKRKFTREATTIPLDQLDGTEIYALENDPDLVVDYKKDE